MRWTIVIGLTLTLTGAAAACGNPLLWAMLFARHPEAKIAHKAELAAREAGIVHARNYPANGQSYHAWSMSSLASLADEMALNVGSQLAPAESLTLLLADEVVGLRFTKGERTVEIIPAVMLSRVEGFDAITTVNAIYSGWYQGLSFQEMVEHKLVVDVSPRASVLLGAAFESRSDPALASVSGS